MCNIGGEGFRTDEDEQHFLSLYNKCVFFSVFIDLTFLFDNVDAYTDFKGARYKFLQLLDTHC